MIFYHLIKYIMLITLYCICRKSDVFVWMHIPPSYLF